MRICLIGPGIMPIPPDNWGAVESLIWDYYQYLNKMGIETDVINNPNLLEVAQQVNNGDYDFVHLHYDDHAATLSQLIKQPFCTTTHYGYVKEHYPDYGGWNHIFRGVLKTPSMISLSNEIATVFKKAGYNKPLKVLRNGARTKEFKFNNNPNKFGVCLGKIEPRKRQKDLSLICGNSCNIDFIGPVIDPSFRNNGSCIYRGIWSKNDLYENLSDYKCLVLISDGEAAPLVVPEALSCGLSLVVSETAAANLDTSLPFIHVLPNGKFDNELPSIINYAIGNNVKYRKQIRDYALNYFDWEVICQEYLTIIKEIIDENSIFNNSNQ
jgi:glycosyltransferase involved in cell wall biosynthesis